MEKLNLKDRKILYELDLDSRQPFAQLGKKVGLHKDVVAYRVKKLQEKGIIKNFYTEVSSYKLGYSCIKFYLTYQNATPEKKREIIDYFMRNLYTESVLSAEGQYDLAIMAQVENIPKFHNMWSSIFNKYRDFFSNQIFYVESMWTLYKKTFLLDEKTQNKEKRILFVESSDDKKVEIDGLDKKILDLLLLNSRIPILEIAQKLNCTVTTINSRIKKLEKRGIILIYSINIDWPKIGYQIYKTDIVLKIPEKRQQIVEYLENNPNLLYRMTSFGHADLELSFMLNNVNELHQIIGDLSSKFPDTIQNYKYYSVTKIHKILGQDFWNR